MLHRFVIPAWIDYECSTSIAKFTPVTTIFFLLNKICDGGSSKEPFLKAATLSLLIWAYPRERKTNNGNFKNAAILPSKFAYRWRACALILPLCRCCVFAVLTCALGSLTDLCFQEICNMDEGNLNDIVRIHQNLCKQLSTASPFSSPEPQRFCLNCWTRGSGTIQKYLFFHWLSKTLCAIRWKVLRFCALLFTSGETLEIVLYKHRNNVNIFVDR